LIQVAAVVWRVALYRLISPPVRFPKHDDQPRIRTRLRRVQVFKVFNLLKTDFILSLSNFGEECIFAAVSAFRGREKSDLTSEGTLNFCNDQTSGHVILDGQDFLLDTKDGSDFGLRNAFSDDF
jgi:hypothetical protein